MIGVVVIERQEPGRARRKLRPRRSLRTIATAIAAMQRVEGMKIHAKRDNCSWCAAFAQTLQHANAPLIPRRLLRDAAWKHRHIDAPGVRIQARAEDRWAGV